jgi:hypothetical protein
VKERTAWRWWAKALGEKASKCDKESDKIALIRTLIFATYLMTNLFIIAGVVRHWNDIPGESTHGNSYDRKQDSQDKIKENCKG